ncbi:MAG: DEAD/DEAH box helicase [Deltaproteobacteria bacterium]|nr:DEAD/DEAH box helicase [Deltaproteobacteria bacterium]
MATFAKGPARLEPVRHEAPECEDFEDAEGVRAYERAVRVHRAFTERFAVTPLDGRADGAWRVSGEAGGTYVVDVVDGSGRCDTCTCPDFQWNGLGTCKHVEAVRRAVATEQPSWRAAFARLGAGPAVPTLSVDAAGRLVAVGSWTQALRRAMGLERRGPLGELVSSGGPALGAGRVQVDDGQSLGGSVVRVTHAVGSSVERAGRARVLLERRDAIRRAWDDGSLGVDVLKRPLFAYQREGVVHLAAAGRALLAGDMGLGKTVQAIAACEVLRARGEARRVVVVTPASLKHQWAREISAYAGRPAAVVGGGAVSRRDALASDAPYLVLSYELTWRELHRLRDLDADVLILDEAQRAKNFRTKTAATLRAIPSRFLFVLTGTPVENRLDDLYSLLQLVDPGILGPLWRFNHDFHRQGRRGKVVGCKNLGRLRERTAPVVLRRLKEEVLDQLPPLTEQTRYTALTPEQVRVESGWRAEAAKYMAIAEKRPLSPREQEALQIALLKARQACDALELCDPGARIKASPKLEEFEALVSEVAAGGTNKVLVFSEWVQMLKLAAARLDRLGIGYAMLTGEVPADKRGALLDRFRQDPDQRVLLSSDAGGVGLNLQVANYVVHLDLPWNPARLDQRTSRAHRLGQTRGVSVTYLCSVGGIERGIEGTLAHKRAVRAAALDPGSEVQELEGQSFSVFLRQMRETLAAMESVASVPPEDGDDAVQFAIGAALEAALDTPPAPEPAAPAVQPAVPHPRPEPEPAPAQPVTAAPEPVTAAPEPVAAAPEPVAPAPGPESPRAAGRSGNRLRLARVVLEAGFPGDAVKASYEALAAAVSGLVDGTPPAGHAALVAAMYKDLVPSGRLAATVPGILARLHDLTTLEALGVDVDVDLARGAVGEAEEWVGRLSA